MPLIICFNKWLFSFPSKWKSVLFYNSKICCYSIFVTHWQETINFPFTDTYHNFQVFLYNKVQYTLTHINIYLTRGLDLHLQMPEEKAKILKLQFKMQVSIFSFCFGAVHGLCIQDKQYEKSNWKIPWGLFCLCATQILNFSLAQREFSQERNSESNQPMMSLVPSETQSTVSWTQLSFYSIVCSVKYFLCSELFVEISV